MFIIVTIVLWISLAVVFLGYSVFAVSTALVDTLIRRNFRVDKFFGTSSVLKWKISCGFIFVHLEKFCMHLFLHIKSKSMEKTSEIIQKSNVFSPNPFLKISHGLDFAHLLSEFKCSVPIFAQYCANPVSTKLRENLSARKFLRIRYGHVVPFDTRVT